MVVEFSSREGSNRSGYQNVTVFRCCVWEINYCFDENREHHRFKVAESKI